MKGPRRLSCPGSRQKDSSCSDAKKKTTGKKDLEDMKVFQAYTQDHNVQCAPAYDTTAASIMPTTSQQTQRSSDLSTGPSEVRIFNVIHSRFGLNPGFTCTKAMLQVSENNLAEHRYQFCFTEQQCLRMCDVRSRYGCTVRSP